jgi:signal transduction histidine kinase
VARTARRTDPDRCTAIGDALALALGQASPGDVLTLANPVGSGTIAAIVNPIAAGRDSSLFVASCQSDFPRAGHRLLLGIAASQTAIAIRQWQAEQALQLLNGTLEQRVEAEVDGRMRIEKAFRQAQKMEAIGQLTGGVAHDFNNLLAAVLGNLELLSRRPGIDSRGLRLIDAAVEGAERGKALTQRLLAFARQQDLKPVAVDAAKLIRGATEMLTRSIGPRVEIRIDLAPNLWRVRVDANQLELALLNLALNARDAMPDGGRLTLSARNETIEEPAGALPGDPLVAGDPLVPRSPLVPGDYVCLAVADTGTGMDQATLARATDPFFTTKGIGKGTGLGLSMVDGMVAQSNGSLRLSSAAGSGTTAELWLPRAGEGATATHAAAREPGTKPRCRKILLVDDDALVCRTTAHMLTDLGHQVLEASSGKMALEMLHAGAAVDMVLTDQAMPGMTGLQLAAQLRASWPELPVMISSGYPELPDEGGLKLPRLVKPYGQEELAIAIAGLPVRPPLNSRGRGRTG